MKLVERGGLSVEKKQITLRLPVDLYEKIQQEAERKGWSVNEQFIFDAEDKYMTTSRTV